MRDVFCAEHGAAITSLGDLQDALGIPYYDDSVYDVAVFIGLSTSLSGRVVSPINPRVIMSSFDVPRFRDLALLAFQRGEQRVEMAARDRDRDGFNFYLLTFVQACNVTSRGCLPGDLYTPAIETDWASFDMKDEEELANTPSDCRQCHRRGRDSSTLLMRELRNPWTHFFAEPFDATTVDSDASGGTVLNREYWDAKGDEPYANFSWAAIRHSTGFGLQGVVEQAQPLVFDSSVIAKERSSTDGVTTGRSPTWDREYETFKLGEHLPLPYFAEDATDPAKLAALTTAYQDFRAKGTSRAALPDLADVFPDDPHARAQIGLQTEPDARPAEALVQACAPCHNDVLDQTISRARFNVALADLSPGEIAAAVDRLRKPRGEPGAMPPPEARQLDEAGRSRLIEYLGSGNFSASDLAMLAHAAGAGMAANVDP